MEYFVLLTTATALIAILAIALYRRQRDVSVLVATGALYYWSLYGAWFVVIDKLGGFSGKNYHYLEYKMFPVALDAAPKYTASNAYGLTNVPTAFSVSGGQVEFTSVSWVKDELEGLYRKLMEGRGTEPLFAKDEPVAAWKAG